MGVSNSFASLAFTLIMVQKSTAEEQSILKGAVCDDYEVDVGRSWLQNAQVDGSFKTQKRTDNNNNHSGKKELKVKLQAPYPIVTAFYQNSVVSNDRNLS